MAKKIFNKTTSKKTETEEKSLKVSAKDVFINELRVDPQFPAKKKFASHIVKKLKELYPTPKCHLDVKNPFELLVSTVWLRSLGILW